MLYVLLLLLHVHVLRHTRNQAASEKQCEQAMQLVEALYRKEPCGTLHELVVAKITQTIKQGNAPQQPANCLSHPLS
jgi:antitoxin component HigA of HigAB toxin-antitoxin module